MPSKRKPASTKRKGKPTANQGSSRAAELTKLFLKTPEMQEAKTTAGAVLKQLDEGNTVSIKIELPRALVQLAEFLERKRAGKAAKDAANVLARYLHNDLHDELHMLTVAPLSFDYYRALWNRFCDTQGAPEEKIADPASGPAQDREEEGPF